MSDLHPNSPLLEEIAGYHFSFKVNKDGSLGKFTVKTDRPEQESGLGPILARAYRIGWNTSLKQRLMGTLVALEREKL